MKNFPTFDISALGAKVTNFKFLEIFKITLKAP